MLHEKLLTECEESGKLLLDSREHPQIKKNNVVWKFQKLTQGRGFKLLQQQSFSAVNLVSLIYSEMRSAVREEMIFLTQSFVFIFIFSISLVKS